MKQTSPTILTPQQWTMADRLKALAFGGRKRGTLGGSLVNDMASLGKTIMLCGDCQGKFDWRRHQYYSVWRYEHQPVTGPCDVCRVQVTGNDGRLFIHESVRPKAWATPDEQKARRQTMVRIANTRY
ncbi:MAG: hypothetical protein KC587_11175 [Nitrospira sp.]|nr:hypothetical protein [Nitrospira sp.]